MISHDRTLVVSTSLDIKWDCYDTLKQWIDATVSLSVYYYIFITLTLFLLQLKHHFNYDSLKIGFMLVLSGLQMHRLDLLFHVSLLELSTHVVPPLIPTAEREISRCFLRRLHTLCSAFASDSPRETTVYSADHEELLGDELYQMTEDGVHGYSYSRIEQVNSKWTMVVSDGWFPCDSLSSTWARAPSLSLLTPARLISLASLQHLERVYPALRDEIDRLPVNNYSMVSQCCRSLYCGMYNNLDYWNQLPIVQRVEAHIADNDNCLTLNGDVICNGEWNSYEYFFDVNNNPLNGRIVMKQLVEYIRRKPRGSISILLAKSGSPTLTVLYSSIPVREVDLVRAELDWGARRPNVFGGFDYALRHNDGYYLRSAVIPFQFDNGSYTFSISLSRLTSLNLHDVLGYASSRFPNYIRISSAPDDESADDEPVESAVAEPVESAVAEPVVFAEPVDDEQPVVEPIDAEPAVVDDEYPPTLERSASFVDWSFVPSWYSPPSELPAVESLPAPCSLFPDLFLPDNDSYSDFTEVFGHPFLAGTTIDPPVDWMDVDVEPSDRTVYSSYTNYSSFHNAGERPRRKIHRGSRKWHLPDQLYDF